MVGLTASALTVVALLVCLTPTERTVSAAGVLRANGDLIRMAAEQDGAVVRLLAVEGQTVTAGQELLSLNSEVEEARWRQLGAEIRWREQALSDLEELRRRLAEQDATRQAMAERVLAEARAGVQREGRRLADSQRVASAEAISLEKEVADLEELVRHQQDLVTAGILARQDLRHTQSNLDRTKLALEYARLKAGGDTTSIDAAREKRLQAETSRTSEAHEAQVKAQDHLLRVEQQRAELEKARAELRDAEQRLRGAVLHAPVTGVVTWLGVHHPGERVRAADVLVHMAPQGLPVVVAAVRNEDIARVKPGLPARVRVDALADRSRTFLSGDVLSVAPDAAASGTETAYEVRVRLSPTAPDRLRLGMRARVDILTGRCTILERLVGAP